MVWIGKLCLGLAYCLFAALYVQKVVLRLRPGLPRVAAALPLIFCNCISPIAFDERAEVVSRGIVAFNLFWLASFKVTSAILLTYYAGYSQYDHAVAWPAVLLQAPSI